MRLFALTLTVVLAGCTATTPSKPETAAAKPAVGKTAPLNKNPYPSTYKPYPGVPTLVRNVTIYDGEGGRVENGSVLLPAINESAATVDVTDVPGIGPSGSTTGPVLVFWNMCA